MWRCFRLAALRRGHGRICSTHVEMFLRPCLRPSSASNLLHACGDVSHETNHALGPCQSAPRMWRCFCGNGRVTDPHGICSTHVEMFLSHGLQERQRPDLLHACGDVSSRFDAKVMEKESAPRMWRCFLRRPHYGKSYSICSTHVEMFLMLITLLASMANLLHACGDVSAGAYSSTLGESSAPRMWRCFCPSLPARSPSAICSTHVEMFLQADAKGWTSRHLLHACGDVSAMVVKMREHLLHACGDVSVGIINHHVTFSSAPRMWRCF